MSTEWKQGTIAMVTLAAPGFNERRGPGPHLMLRDVSGVKEVWRLASTGIVHEDAEVASIAPVVVLHLNGKPEVGPQRTDARLLIDMLRETAENFFTPDAAALAVRVADQIEAQTGSPTPPKPDAPSDPAARVEDGRENIWRLLADGEWVCTSGPDIGEYVVWSALCGRGPLVVTG